MNYNGLLDINLLEDYLDGKLDGKAMHQVEKLSLEDPFVAEALAGLSQSPLRSQSLSLLQKQLHERIALKPVETKRWTITAQRLSIASAAAVLFIAVSVLFLMKQNSRKQIEANQAKNVKIEIAPNSKTVTEAIPPAPVAVEIDKALADAKTNIYAGIKKPKSIVTDAAPVTVSSAPVAMAENKEEAAISSKVAARMSSARVVSPEPVNGWAKFEEYVLLNNKLIKNNQFVGKSVQLSFSVEQNNRPKDIKIVSGLTKQENEEAIRLLIDGPDWKYHPNYSEAIIVNIKF